MAVSLAVSTQYKNVTDTEPMAASSQQHEMRCVASLGCIHAAKVTNMNSLADNFSYTGSTNSDFSSRLLEQQMQHIHRRQQ